MFKKSTMSDAYIFLLSVVIVVVSPCLREFCQNAYGSKLSPLTKADTAPPLATLNTYVQSVKNRLEHYWFPAKGSNARVSVAFRIDKNGRPYWLELTDVSPVKAVNQSAQDAIFYASPFSPLPPSLGDHLDLSVDFNSDFTPVNQPGYSRPVDSDLSASLSLLKKATALIKQGEGEGAIQVLKQARALTPCDIRVRDKLAEAYVEVSKSKSDEEATALLHQALLLDHNNSDARAKLNRLMTESALDAHNFDTRVTVARQYAKSSQYDDALCEYGEAWLLNNDHKLIEEINMTCLRRRKYPDVSKWQATIKASDNPGAHVALGHVFESCGQDDKALQEYQTALSMDSSTRSAQEAAQKLQTKMSDQSEEKMTTSEKAAFADDFPYANLGSRSISIIVVKNRKANVDYLTDACPKMITRWATNRIPLRVYVENDTRVLGYRPQFRQFMIDAFATWVKASEGRLSFAVVDYPQQANIVCRWVADPAQGKLTGNEQGLTRSQVFYRKNDPNSCLVESAVISILTLCRTDNEPLSDLAAKAVCLHELGHALGISGHSPYDGDMMYPTFSPYDIPLRLTDRDIATIKRLYQGYSHPTK